MAEVQTHGFFFEKWIRDTFFNSCIDNYSAKWDISKESNKQFGNLPISIKTAKYGSSINLGDAIRQISIQEEFILIVGFWKQVKDFKELVNVTATTISMELWSTLWDPLTIDDVKKLDKLIKSYTTDYKIIREKAQSLKAQSPFKDCLITLNPKIDSKTQRRLQCSISFGLFFKKILTLDSKGIFKSPKLWNIEVPKPWESKSRTFNF